MGSAGRTARGAPSRLVRPRPGQPPFQRPVELGLAVFTTAGLLRHHSELTNPDLPGLMYLGMALIIASQVLLVVECIRPRNLPWPIMILASSGLVLNVVAQYGSDGPLVWRIDAWLVSLLVYLVLFRQPGHELLILILITVVCSLFAALHHSVDWLDQLLSWAFVLVTPMILALAMRVVAVIVDEHLASQDIRRQSAKTDESVRAHAESLARLRREMHDSLLHCLQLIAAPWAAMSADEARALCASTMTRLAQVPQEERVARTEPIGRYLRQVLAEEPCAITWHGEGRPLPWLAAVAIASAARETVRNVIKHGTRPEADLRISDGASVVRVEIADSGPGFDPASAARRHGWQSSVVERMTSIGGLAEVRPNAEGGTTVVLTWPAPLPAPPEPLSARGRAGGSLVPLPLMAASLLNAVAYHQGLTLPAALGIWLALAAVFALTAWRLRRTGIGYRLGWGLTALATAATLANYAWIDPTVTNGWDLWAISLSCSIIVLVLPSQPFKWCALAMAAVFSVGSLLGGMLLIGPRAAFTTHYGAALAIVSYTMITLILSLGATSVSEYAHQTRRLEETIQARIKAAAERETVWRAWLDHAGTLTTPFLDAIASGRLDPEDPATRTTAALLEARVRDDLRLWPESAAVAEELDALRRRGWTCRLDTDQVTLETRDELVALLRCLPAPAGGQQLTITQWRGALTITVTNPGLSDGQRAGIARWLMTVAEDFTQARVPAPGSAVPGSAAGSAAAGSV
ncbi:MAG TPA: hypothetical protein PKE40_07465 [Arachnia sp.]|nr:hypothetical protein [Arachnia sp.]HMT86173.1 hypothetical protein [Arachnia sp.]